MMKREESSWSKFQFVLLVLGTLMILLGGANLLVLKLQLFSFSSIIIGFVVLGIGLVLILLWFFIHRAARHSIIDSLGLIETKYLEKLQKAAGKGLLISIIGTIFPVIASIYFIVICLPTTEDFFEKITIIVLFPVIGAVFGFALFAWIFWLTPYNKFSRYFKERYVLEVLQTNRDFTELSYHMKKGMDKDKVSKMNLFLMGQKFFYESEDTLTGKYKGKSFMFGDVTTAKEDNAGKVKYKKNLFSGQVAAFYDLDNIKESDGFLLIREIPLDGPNAKPLEQISTEFVAFNDKFEVYAEKPLNAFYILTPPFMEKIIDVGQRLEGELSLCFYRNNLYTAVNSNLNIFDPLVDVPLKEQQERIEDKDVKLIKEIGDVLLKDS